MKNFAAVFFVAIFSLAVANSVSQAQVVSPPPLVSPPDGGRTPHFPNYDERYWETKPPRNDSFRNGGPSSEPRVMKRGPLAPSDADRANYAGFLKQSNTGLIRLLPRTFPQSKFYSKPPVKINGGGAYYSFSRFSHEYGYGSDLELSSTIMIHNGTEQPPTHQLSVGFAGADFGMLTNLGEVPVETVTSDLRTQFMRDYKVPRKEAEACAEFRRFRQGVTVNGQMYRSTLPIQVGATYLLRSINYDESDVLVAFSVVRQDTDKSLIIAWKLLKQFGRPRLMHRFQ